MRALVPLIVIFCVLTCSETALAGGDVPITLTPDGIVSAPVMVNGRGPFQFVVDTGASRTVVSAELARTLELPIVAKTEVFTATGREFRPVVQLAASVGSSPSVGLMASVVAGENLKAATDGASGILGQDLLMTLNYTLDYERGRFTTSLPDKRNPLSVELPMQIEDGRIVLTLPGRGRQPAARFVPDSGSTMFVVYDRGGPPRFAMELLDGAMRIGTMTSTHTVPMVRLREVRLGALALRDQLAAVVRRSNESGLDVDGLLPLKIFASAAFDMEGRRVIVTPRR